jgi:hypothetical protein
MSSCEYDNELFVSQNAGKFLAVDRAHFLKASVIDAGATLEF